jgi:hypothetical protein
MNVGDLILSVRALGPDPPRSLSAPNGAPTLSVVAGGFVAGPATWYLVYTLVNEWGETAPSSESSIAVGAGQTIVLTPSFIATDITQIGIRVYYGESSGAETIMEEFQYPADFSAGSVTLTGNGQYAIPPVASSALLPDTDGGFASAALMYRWLNESLKAIARATGGIQDTCGVASVSGQRRYVAPGQWLRFNQCFYDGWELDLGNKAETFRNRNLTANISISLMVDAQSDTTRIELYWTPSRTSGTTTTSAPYGAADANIGVNQQSGWLLQDGLAAVGDEILTYSAITGAQLQNCIRGWNGTQPGSSSATNGGVPISELNIELTGYRMPAVYSVGDAALTLGVPPGWEPFLKDFMLGLFRDAEQERQDAQALKDGATKAAEQWAKSNKPVAGPRQCRMYGDYGIRGLVPGGLTGGIIIP